MTAEQPSSIRVHIGSRRLINQIQSFVYVPAAAQTALGEEVRPVPEEEYAYTTVHRVDEADIADAVGLYEGQGWEFLDQTQVLVPHGVDNSGREITVVKFDLQFRRPAVDAEA